MLAARSSERIIQRLTHHITDSQKHGQKPRQMIREQHDVRPAAHTATGIQSSVTGHKRQHAAVGQQATDDIHGTFKSPTFSRYTN